MANILRPSARYLGRGKNILSDVFIAYVKLDFLETGSTTSSRFIHSTDTRTDFHFDTHHFVQKLEKEGLNRAQAEGIMTAMAEVIDESVRNMTHNMVSKAEHEKVYH